MEEKRIEQKLVKMTSQSGGVALKFVSPGCAGVPDRLVLMPGGKAAFVEDKAHQPAPAARFPGVCVGRNRADRRSVTEDWR